MTRRSRTRYRPRSRSSIRPAARRIGGPSPGRLRLLGAAAGTAITLAAVAQVRDPWPATPTGAAPPVYRCGDSYGNRPCGDAPPLHIDRDPTPAERAQAADVARRERRLADELAAQRHAREAVPPPVAPRSAAARRGCPPTPPPVAPATASRPSAPPAWWTAAGCPTGKRYRAGEHAPAASDTWSIRLPKRR